MRRRRERLETPPDRLQALVLIHIGHAWRAHQDGEPLRAVYYLRLALECVNALIEQWRGEEAEDLP